MINREVFVSCVLQVVGPVVIDEINLWFIMVLRAYARVLNRYSVDIGVALFTLGGKRYNLFDSAAARDVTAKRGRIILCNTTITP